MLKLSKLISKIKVFSRLSFASKRLLFEALLYSAVARAVILLIPFKKYRKYFGRVNEETPLDINREQYIVIRTVEWAVKAVCLRTPWESKCLVQALTAQRMLKKREIASTLYLGVNKNVKDNLSAHAWLRSGQVYVTGGYNKDEFVQVAKFSI
jgi:hypothetical protein